MAQHFLLSADSRTLSFKAIYKAGEEKAYETFCKVRWPETDGAPVCPRCGSLDAYSIATRRKFKCRAAECRHQFSVTSGTIFASRKLAFSDLLAGILLDDCFDCVKLVRRGINSRIYNVEVEIRKR